MIPDHMTHTKREVAQALTSMIGRDACVDFGEMWDYASVMLTTREHTYFDRHGPRHPDMYSIRPSCAGNNDWEVTFRDGITDYPTIQEAVIAFITLVGGHKVIGMLLDHQ